LSEVRGIGLALKSPANLRAGQEREIDPVFIEQFAQRIRIAHAGLP
jgi:hypothetical protein